MNALAMFFARRPGIFDATEFPIRKYDKVDPLAVTSFFRTCWTLSYFFHACASAMLDSNEFELGNIEAHATTSNPLNATPRKPRAETPSRFMLLDFGVWNNSNIKDGSWR